MTCGNPFQGCARMPSSLGLGLDLDQIWLDATQGVGLGLKPAQPPAPVAPQPKPPDPIDAQLEKLNGEEPGRYVAMTPDEFEAWRSENATTFTGAMSRGVDVAQGMGYGAVEAIGEATGIEAVRRFGQEGRERNVKEAQEHGIRSSFADIRSVGDFAQWAKETIGEQIPIMAGPVGGAVGGAAAGALVGGPVGATIGGVLGAFVPSMVLGTGEVQGAIKEKDPNASAPGWAFAGGTAIATLDSIFPGKLGTALASRFGRAAAEQIAKRVLTKPLKDGVVRRTAKGAVSGLATEGFTEAVQEAIGEVAAAQGTETPVDWQGLPGQMLEAGAAGAIVGGVAGAGGGAARRPQPAATVPPPPEEAEEAPEQSQPQPQSAPVQAPVAAPRPPAGPLGRALESGNAEVSAAAANELVPPGSRVAIGMPGAPPIEVTVSGYHAGGMDVVDDSGETHTLTMDDPEVTVTPVTPPAAPAVQAPAEVPREGEILSPKKVDLEQKPWTVADGNPWGMSDEDYAVWREQPENREAVEAWERDNKIIDAAPQPVAPAKPQPEKKPKAEKSLPQQLAGAKPRYSFGSKQFTLTFDNDADKAAYIAAQDKPSKRDADYVTFAAEALGTDEIGVRAHGRKVREAIKALARDAEPGELRVPRNAIVPPPKAPETAGIGAKATAKEKKPPKAPEKRELPFSASVGGREFAFPDEKHAALFDLAKRRQMFRKGGRNPAEADKLLIADRTRIAEMFGMSVDEVNAASDEYRHQIEQAAKTAGDGPQIAPAYERVSTDTDRDRYNTMTLDERKVVLDKASVSWSPKIGWDKLSKPVQEKLRKAMVVPDGDNAKQPEPERKRQFPAYTTEQLREGLADSARVRGMSPETVQKMRDELAAREAGISKPKVTPQIVPEKKRPAASESQPVGKKPVEIIEKWKLIGVNSKGQQLYEDDRGVRSIVENKIRRTEPVSVIPTRGGVQIGIDRTNRTEYMTAEEAVAQADEAAKAAPQPEPVPPPEPEKPAYGAANKLVSADRVEEVRKRLREKLKGQLNVGIDPEILALGTELAAFHIEAGARRFIDVARAVAGDLGTNAGALRKYLRAWYNGARDLLEDSGADVSGMDDPETVRAELAKLEQSDEPAKLDQPSPQALEGAPSQPVPRGDGEREAGNDAAGRGRADGLRDEPASGGRPDRTGGVGGGPGELPVSAAGGQRAGERQSAVEPERVESDRRDARGDEDRGADSRDSEADDHSRGPQERIEGQVARNEPAPESAATPAPEIAGNYTITAADELGEGGQRTKYRQNIEAIRLLNKLESEGRRATRSEQKVLAKYVGWGGIKAVFPREDGSIAKGWEAAAAEIRDLLTEEEYKSAARSTQNAHYTSAEIVNAMWRGVLRLGFAGGRVLEPSVGTGNFLGLMPGGFRAIAQITGVELDRITGGITKHLYPNSNIQAPVAFQDFAMPDDYFDLAIGNPPFGSERVYDRERRHLKFSIHNFFFAKSLDAVRPGGVLAMVVSNFLMDAGSTRARQYLADRADLLGAIRLPNDAFAKNAGTEVTTDIIFLRKRKEGEAPSGEAWLNTVTFRDEEGREVPLNEYFERHPEQMLGKFGGYGEMYREGSAALIKRPGQDTAKLLREAINRLPEGVMEPPGVIAEEPEIVVPHNVTEAMVGSMFLDDSGAIWLREPDMLGEPRAVPADVQGERTIARVSGMIRVRDAFATLRRSQLDRDASEKKIENLRNRLNAVYDAFVAKQGPINADANRRVFRDDPTWPQISALEDRFDKGVTEAVAKRTGETPRPPSADKAPVFSRRTQYPYERPTNASSAKDALAISQSELNRIDLDFMSRLYGQSPEAMIEELGDLIYKNPEGGYEPRDAYLSGNVKRKLALAVEANKQSPGEYERNIEALRAVIPADINPADIGVAPGSHWVPARHVAAFVDHITEAEGATAIYSPENARWVITPRHASTPAETRWGSNRATVPEVINAVLHGRTITIRDKHPDGSSSLNQTETDAANVKVEAVKEEWRRWIWQDQARRQEIAALYNDTFNTDVPRAYDGSHLSFRGKVSDDVIRLRPSQVNFVWRVLQSSTALADHIVGAGKTWSLVAAAMEMRRMGVARKPMFVVPNHLVGQWAADFIRLYPGANILAATKKDFEVANRKRLMARVATGDWDAVIVAHSSFGRIAVDPAFQKRFIEDQIADIEASLAILRDNEGKKARSVAQLEKWRDNLEAKLQRLLEGTGKDEGKDEGLTFQELGVDALFVDEAHEYKNLGFSTSMQRIGSLGTAANGGSQKAADLYMKVQSVMEMTGGRNIVFATGTPISNSMAEMFTMQRYLSPRLLKDLGLAHFDAWARMFGQVVTDWELSPAGKYRLNSRFAKFVNVPELLRQYRGFADVITLDDIKKQLAAQGRALGVPKMIGGKPQLVVVDRSQHQAEYMGVPIKDKDGNDTENYPKGTLIWRSENLPKGPPKKGDDNMLKIMSDARKSALDMRLIDPAYPDHPGSKINNAADRMKVIYDQWGEDKGTQLVFIDLSVPKKAAAKERKRIEELVKAAEGGDESAQEKLDKMSPDEFLAIDGEFSVYDDLRQKLIDRGIPANEIAFIHDANTEQQKEDLFGKVRSGRVRIMLGSTAKMGAGMNVQERLVALHHMDAPWRPSDLEQREGRIIRQGNSLMEKYGEAFEVGVFRYATKNTLDARMWQTIEGKARFIEQLRKGDLTVREIEDIDGEAANAAEMKAAASGNPLILEEMDLRQKIRKLDGQRVSHDREQFAIEQRIARDESELERLTNVLPAAKRDAEKAKAIPQEFEITIGGKKYDKHKEAGAAVILRARKMQVDGADSVELGTYGGFGLTLEAASLFGGSRSKESVVIHVESEHPYQIDIGKVETADPTGTALRVANGIRKLADRPVLAESKMADIRKELPGLKEQVRPWGKEDELAQLKTRHQEVIAALRPKKQDQPQQAEPQEGEDDAPLTRVQPARLTPRAQQSRGDIQAAVLSAVERVAGRDAAQRTATPDEIAMPVGKDWNAAGDPDVVVTGGYFPRRETNNVVPLIVIALAKNPSAVQTAYHEGWHAIEGTLTPGEVEILRRETQRLREYVARHVPGVRDLIMQAEAEEVWAEAAATYVAGHVEGIGYARRVFDKIARLLRAVRNAMAGLGFQTAEDVFEAFSEGEMAERRGSLPAEMRNRWWRQVDGASAQVSRERRTSGIPDRRFPRNLKELSAEVKSLGEDARNIGLGLLPLNVLADWAAPIQVAIGQYIDLKRAMDAFRNKKQSAADETVQKWQKVIGKGGQNAQALSDLMHDSTLAGIDPSRADAETAGKPGYGDLRRRWNALSPAAQELYREVRDAYVEQQNELDAILLENVGKAMDQQIRDAERQYNEELEEIRDRGLTGEEREKAVADADRKFQRATSKLKLGKKARLAALRKSFEASRVPEPYFPLARFGAYFATVRDAEGKVISFSRRETAGARDRLVNDLKRAYPDAKIETGVISNKNDIRAQMDPRLMAEINDILGGANVSDDVMDQIWQRYLETMPDLSIRKRFIHRRGVPGFHRDAMRSFANHMFHAAHQMARVKYGTDLGELVNQAKDQARASGEDSTAAGKLANELESRHAWVMNPENSSWATNATTLGFLYFLGASPASAIVNLSQTVILGVPILGSRFGSGKAIAALGKAAKDFAAGKGGVEGGDLSDEQRRAIRELYDRGTLDQTRAHDLAGVGEQGTGYNPVRDKVVGALAFLFHQAERFNREVTALAAYRLAREAGMDHAAAVDKAAELTWLTHFDYGSGNRPRLLQSDVARVVFLFKNFQINMLYRLFRDTQQAFQGASPQAKREARAQLAGTMGMFALMAGTLGVPLMNLVIIPLYGLVFGDDDEKSAVEEFRGDVIATLGPQLGGMVLDGVPGYVTGTSLTRRIGMGDLWFQTDDRVQTARDWWSDTVTEIGGPLLGMVHNVYRGYNVIRDDKGVARGIETMMPTAARNLMRAWRYQQEGALSMRGDPIMAEVSVQDSLKQALGFTPARIAEQYKLNTQKKNMERRINDRRKRLLDAFARAIETDDEAGRDAVLEDIKAFNSVPIHAARAITARTIRSSLRTRARLSQRAEHGIIIQNRRFNHMLNQELPERVY